MIGPDGRMNEEAGELAGLTQEEADERVLEWLKEHGQLEKRESYRHTVALCDRCHSRIEPRISLQWWCSMDGPAKARARGAPLRPRPLPPGVAAPFRDSVARGRPGLEHLPPDLVGPSAAGVGVPGRAHHRRGDRARSLRRMRIARADALHRRPRHVVLIGALAVCDARLAGGHRGPPRVLSRAI